MAQVTAMAIMNTDGIVSPSPAMVQVLTTEHFTLQGARSVVIAEINGRATIFLSAVSSSLVALAFVTTLARADELVRGFALILLPVLCFMGYVTKARLEQLSFTDFNYQRAINRIRHFYVDIAPEAGQYLTLPIHDDLPGISESSFGHAPSWWLGLLTAAQMVAVVFYVVAGLTIWLLTSWYLGAGNAAASVIGLGFSLALAIFDFYQQEKRWVAHLANNEVRFPSPAADTAEIESPR